MGIKPLACTLTAALMMAVGGGVQAAEDVAAVLDCRVVRAGGDLS